MKFLILLFVILSLTGIIYAQPWYTVGYEQFSEDEVFEISMVTIGTTPYVAFRDVAYGDKISVMYYDGESWVYLGGSGGISPASASYPSLTVDGSGRLYVAYMDSAYGNRATVMCYDGSWYTIGDYGSASTSGAEYISLHYSTSAGQLYIGYKDLAVEGRGTVRYFYNEPAPTFNTQPNQQLLSPQHVGKYYPPFPKQISGLKTTNQSIAKNNARKQISPCRKNPLTHIKTATNIKNSCMLATTKKDTTSVPGGSWEIVGEQGFTPGEANYVSISTDVDGWIFFAYMDGENGYRASVHMYDTESWLVLGNPGFSIGAASYITLNAVYYNDYLYYISYRDGGNSNYASTKCYAWDVGSWNTVGYEGFSDGPVQYVHSTNLLYEPYYPCVVYCDLNNGSIATAKRWNGSTWMTIGDYYISNNQAAYTVIQFNSDGIAYVAYKDFTIPSQNSNSKEWYARITVKENLNPTIIVLLEFNGVSQNGNVNITWKTGSETDTLGFYICRADQQNGPYQRMNERIIPSQGSPTSGADYSYQDTPSQTGEYFYRLESVDTQSRSTYHPPISVTHQ